MLVLSTDRHAVKPRILQDENIFISLLKIRRNAILKGNLF